MIRLSGKIAKRNHLQGKQILQAAFRATHFSPLSLICVACEVPKLDDILTGDSSEFISERFPKAFESGASFVKLERSKTIKIIYTFNFD